MTRVAKEIVAVPLSRSHRQRLFEIAGHLRASKSEVIERAIDCLYKSLGLHTPQQESEETYSKEDVETMLGLQ